MAYISITDGRIGRYDSDLSPPEIEGFYTDNFSSCNIIMLYFQEKGRTRISFIHADCSITEKDVADEIKWVGADCKKIVARRLGDKFSQIRKAAALGSLIEKFSEEAVLRGKRAVSISLNGHVKFYDYNDLPELIVHPQEWFLQSVYRLNVQFKACQDQKQKIELENKKLIFDIKEWGKLQKHDSELLPLAEEFIRHFSSNCIETCLEDFLNSSACVRGFIKRKIDFELLTYEPHDNDYIIAIFALIYATKNNYRNIFNAKLKVILEHEEDLSSDELRVIKKSLSLEYVEARKMIRKFNSRLESIVISGLEDINLICHHATARKDFIVTNTIKDSIVGAPPEVPPSAAMFSSDFPEQSLPPGVDKRLPNDTKLVKTLSFSTK